MNKKSALYSCYNQTLTRLLDSLVQCALYIYGGFLFMQGELSLGGVMAFISYSGYVLGPITAIMSIRYIVSSIRPSLKRLNAFSAWRKTCVPSWPRRSQKAARCPRLPCGACNFHTRRTRCWRISISPRRRAKRSHNWAERKREIHVIDLILRFARPQRGRSW